MSAHIICLPVEGSPYIIATVKEDAVELSHLQEAVDGRIAAYPRTEVTIHPMFCENPRWNMARQLLTSASTKVWVNEDGIAECSVNFALIIKNPMLRPRGCPHLMGNVCLVVPEAVFKVLGFTPEMFPDEEEEEEDDEDELDF